MKDGKVNLFIYGSLRDRNIFQSVSGLSFTRRAYKIDNKTLFAEPAFLPHYRRVSPDNVYYYAIAAPSSRIEGFVIHDVPAYAMAEIDKYEGKRYDRETVHVNTANGSLEAQAYLVTHDSMEIHFGDRFHVNLIHELWLRKRIEKFIKRRTRPGERTIEGYSIGGLFALYTLFTKPETFNRYIVGSPYLLWNNSSIFSYEEFCKKITFIRIVFHIVFYFD